MIYLIMIEREDGGQTVYFTQNKRVADKLARRERKLKWNRVKRKTLSNQQLGAVSADHIYTNFGFGYS